MRLLDRYIGRQLLVTAIFSVAVLSVVLVLCTIFKKLLELLVNQDAPPSLVMSVIAAILSSSLTLTIPWGFLTSVLLVFGRLSAENELTAMRASGVSIPRACLSVWVLAALCAAACLWINFDVAPRAQQAMRNAIFKIATGNPLAIFGTDKVIEDFPRRKIYVEKTEGTRLSNILVYELDAQNILKNVMFAREGTIGMETVRVKTKDGGEAEEKQIILKFSGGRYEQRDEAHPRDLSRFKSGITLEEGSLAISLQELYEKRRKRPGVSVLPIGELLAAGGKLEAVIEVNKRISDALASLAFALLAVPLAITAQRKETSVGFAISVVIAITYFLLSSAVNLAKNNPGVHPELLVWLPNFVFMSIGGYRLLALARR